MQLKKMLNTKKSDQSQDEKQKDGSSRTQETKENAETIKGSRCNKVFYVPRPLNHTEKWCLDMILPV